jgi:hypothetical protein
MNFPKNIFFYWDGPNIPHAVIENVDNYKKLNPDFRVVLANDADIVRYASAYPTLINLFQCATIAALKSDIARMVLLNEEGGAWIDCNTTLQKKEAISEIFSGCEKFKFALTVMPTKNFNLKSSFLIAYPKTELANLLISSMTEKLYSHYENEKSSVGYVPYNFFMWVVPVVAYKLLDYKIDEQSINFMNNNYRSQKFINPNIGSFQKYSCGLVDVSGLLKFYGTNMDHHHGDNFHLHWSKLQQTQKLFF